MEEEHYIYVPMWVFGIGFFVLSLIGCSHMAVDVMNCKEEPFVHSCPEQGHGECPICPPKQQYIDLSVLDYHCVDCELVYEYEIYFIPELEENEKVLVLD